MIFITTTTAIAQKHNIVRVEIGSAISSGTIRFTLGHKIADNWSIAAETGMNIKGLIKRKDNETITHWNTLSFSGTHEGQRQFRDNFTEVSFYAQYWPGKVYNGPVISLGTVLKDRSGADILTSIGYTFQIWSGIRADLLYNLCLIESIQSTKISPSGIRIGISYVF